MRLSFFPTCESLFAIDATCVLARAIHAVCLGRNIETEYRALADNVTVEGDIPDDIASIVRCVHRFTGDGLNGRRTCGFVIVHVGPAEALGAKTNVRWAQCGDVWTVMYKKGNATAIAKGASPTEALEGLLKAIARLPLTDETDGATVVA